MMANMPQAFSPHPAGLQQHPGVPQGHPGMGPAHPQQAGQPGMPQQMHMGVSGPGGPQMQPGAVMAMVPQGGPSQHALQHLNPGNPQAQFAMQQQQMFANNPQAAQQQQQFMLQQQQQRQQAMARAQMMQQYQQAGGNPAMMPNGINPNMMSNAQFAAMRQGLPGGMQRVQGVPLPQHLQQQQAQLGMQQQQQEAQQQAQQQQQQQQQMLAAQQMAMQNAQGANQQQANNPQMANLQNLQQQQQQAQQAQQQQQQQQQAQQQQQQQQQQQAQQQQQQQQAAQQQAQQQQQAAAAAAAQQNQNLNQPQPQAQPQQQGQPQTPQGQPGQQQQAQPQPGAQAQPVQAQPHPMANQPAQQTMNAMMLRNRNNEQMKGQCTLVLKSFGDNLSAFSATTKPIAHYEAGGLNKLQALGQKQQEDLNIWENFVAKFFAANGVLRHSVLVVDDKKDGGEHKQYEVTFPALARYFHTHFESGVHNMQMTMEKGSEKDLAHNCYYLESSKSSFIYWFDNGSQLVANGTLRVQFDMHQKIELFEFVTTGHEEYVARTRVVEAARPMHEWSKEWRNVNLSPDGKQSPETTKKGKARQMKSPATAPPEIDLPDSKVKMNMGITPSVFRFLELAEVMGQMNPLFSYSHQNNSLPPYEALGSYVTNVAVLTNGGVQMGGMMQGPRTPSMGQFNLGQSPAASHLNLPDGGMTGSPAQGHMQAPAMALQQSQQGTSSSGPSANTSPNQSNKRRRASGVKAEDVEAAGGSKLTKPSPRIGGKRQKGNPA